MTPRDDGSDNWFVIGPGVLHHLQETGVEPWMLEPCLPGDSPMTDTVPHLCNMRPWDGAVLFTEIGANLLCCFPDSPLRTLTECSQVYKTCYDQSQRRRQGSLESRD